MSEKIRHSSSSVVAADLRYVSKLARDNYVGPGALCKALEQEMANLFFREAVILASSGEGALALALHRLKNIFPSLNEVVVSSYVCAAVVNAILSQGLQPVFADVASGSLNLGIGDVQEHRLTAQTLAILCTHMGGFPDDLIAAGKLGVPVISDCAQGIGSSLQGQSLLSFGQMAITSFGSTKFLTGGLGGAVLCDGMDGPAIRRLATAELAVTEYRAEGFIPTLGQHTSDLNSGLTLAQLGHLPDFVLKRKRIALKYDKVLGKIKGVDLPVKVEAAEPNWFRYYFLSDHASEWICQLQAEGVDARPSISHVMTEYFPQLGMRTELARQAPRMVSLPIYPGLTAAQVATLIKTLQRVAIAIERRT